MTRSDLLSLALAFDSDTTYVRAQVAAWLRGFGDAYADGCAASLMRREPRAPIYCSPGRASA